jgi:hypothetical protein
LEKNKVLHKHALYPEQQKELYENAKNADIMDNPVIAIMTCKN